MNQAYSRLSPTRGHITDCKLVCMYWTHLVLVRPAASLYSASPLNRPEFSENANSALRNCNDVLSRPFRILLLKNRNSDFKKWKFTLKNIHSALSKWKCFPIPWKVDFSAIVQTQSRNSAHFRAAALKKSLPKLAKSRRKCVKYLFMKNKSTHNVMK